MSETSAVKTYCAGCGLQIEAPCSFVVIGGAGAFHLHCKPAPKMRDAIGNYIATIDQQRAEIARLKAELEEARRSPDGVVAAYVHADLLTRAETAEARAETAEAAAGAMREALEWVLPMAKSHAASNPVGSNTSLILHAENTLDGPTIGTEVMRVVRAARELGLSHSDNSAGAVPCVYFHPFDPEAGYSPSRVWIGNADGYKDTAITFRVIDELAEALAALGGTHER